MTAPQLNELTDYLCERARAKETEYDALRLRLDGVTTRAVRAEAQLALFEGLDADRVRLAQDLAVARTQRGVSWLWIPVGVAVGVALGVGVGLVF